MMKISAPIYYKDFKCIADRCRHSCCIGWEIDIDGDTLSRYEAADNAYAEQIRESLDFSEGVCSFRLTEGERCPHLDENGLCRIITRLGEGWLSEICREHPRFYNPVGDGTEVGLGLCCEEAARLVLSCPDYLTLFEVEETEGEVGKPTSGKLFRGEVYAVLANAALPYRKRLDALMHIHRINPEVISDGGWREIFSELEYLEEGNRKLFAAYSSAASVEGREEEAERFLAYLIYRHLSPLTDPESLRPTLCFCLALERLFTSLTEKKEGFPALKAEEAARIISSEIEYSEDNTDRLIAELDYALN